MSKSDVAVPPVAVGREGRVTNKKLRVEVTCKGIKPLLMNKMTQEQLLALYYKDKAPKNAPRGEPRDEAAKRAYIWTVKDSHEGELYIPGRCLWSNLVAAGQFVRLDGKRQVSTADSTILSQFLELAEGPEDPLFLGTKQFEVDIQKGTNPNGGEAVCIIRPRIDSWTFTCTVTIDTAEIAEDQIRLLFDIGGKRRGLLDFRPMKKGIYGQYQVENWHRLPAVDTVPGTDPE